MGHPDLGRTIKYSVSVESSWLVQMRDFAGFLPEDAQLFWARRVVRHRLGGKSSFFTKIGLASVSPQLV